MTVQGGNIESKTIGVPIGLNGTFINTELIDNKIQLSKDSDGLFYEEGMWTSRVIDIQDSFESFGKVFVTNVNNGTSSIAVLTRTSDDGLVFDNWTAIAMDGSILSVKRRYISVRIVFYASFSDMSIPITGIQLANTNQYVNGNDNSISLKRNYEYDMELDNSWTENDNLYRKSVTKDEWLAINSININNKNSGEKIYLDPSNSYGVTLSESNLKANYSGSIYNKIRASEGVSEGKHYFEVDVINGGAIIIGLILESVNLSLYQDVITIGNANRGIYPYNNALFPSNASYPFGTVVGSTVSFLIDMDNGTLEFWNNGVTRGIAYSNLKIPNEKLYPFFSSGNAGTNEIRVNFGGSPFKYNIPNGYAPYENLISNKSFILNNGEYKKITNQYQIQTVSSTIPSYEVFNSEGMNSLSPLLNRTLTTLNPLPMIDRSDILSGNGKVFSKILDLNKYLDIKSINVDRDTGVYKLIINHIISNQYFSLLNDKILIIPSFTSDNVVKYGVISFDEFNIIYDEIKYLIQDTINEDVDGLWKKQLNKKPLSIKFE